MKRVIYKPSLLAWQYRPGHEDAMVDAMVDNDLSAVFKPIMPDAPRMLVNDRGATYSVFEDEWVILSSEEDVYICIVGDEQFKRDYAPYKGPAPAMGSAKT